jgi:uncharacterized membrane protein YesL
MDFIRLAEFKSKIRPSIKTAMITIIINLAKLSLTRKGCLLSPLLLFSFLQFSVE